MYQKIIFIGQNLMLSVKLGINRQKKEKGIFFSLLKNAMDSQTVAIPS